MTRDRAVVCSIAGSLHADNEAYFRRTLTRALEQQPGVLAVDLSAVDLLTSSGLNVLLVVRRKAIQRGVRLVLVAPSAPARQTLRITEVDTVLPAVPSLAHALGEHEAHAGAHEE